MGAGLFKDVSDAELDRTLGDIQGVGYFCVGHALNDKAGSIEYAGELYVYAIRLDELAGRMKRVHQLKRGEITR